MSDAAATDIRASFGQFPPITQAFWTWFTGKALPHQQPLVRQTWWSYLALTLVIYLAGLGLSAAALSLRFDGWGIALAVGMGATLSSARVMILVIAHQCIHGCFSRRRWLDRIIGELVTVLTVFQGAKAFRDEHFHAHHREAIFATEDDPPVQVLMSLGMRPGMTRWELWQQALFVFLSPGFYLRGAAERIWGNLTSPPWRRVLFILWFGFWISLPLWLENGLAVLAIAFILPVVFLAQLSALLDKMGEHAWLVDRDLSYGKRHYHVSSSWARFCGRGVPIQRIGTLSGALAWGGWILSMLFYHLPARLFVLVGDLPNHDFHHRYPATPNWMVAAYARQLDIDGADPNAPPYSEVWGLFQAIDVMFGGMSRALPTPPQPSQILSESL